MCRWDRESQRASMAPGWHPRGQHAGAPSEHPRGVPLTRPMKTCFYIHWGFWFFLLRQVRAAFLLTLGVLEQVHFPSLPTQPLVTFLLWDDWGPSGCLSCPSAHKNCLGRWRACLGSFRPPLMVCSSLSCEALPFPPNRVGQAFHPQLSHYTGRKQACLQLNNTLKK